MNRNVVVSLLLWFLWGALTLLLIFNPAMAQTAGVPSGITIDYLTELYGPVFFNHERHVEYAACTECHHHTTGSIPTKQYCRPCHNSKKETKFVGCHSCHLAANPVTQMKPGDIKHSPYHIDIVGLKGAYHLNCIDCHEAIGTGPTECSGCHEITVSAERFFHVNSTPLSVTEQSKTSVEGE